MADRLAKLTRRVASATLLLALGVPLHALDPVARLARGLEEGERTLGFEAKWGYLRSLLEALDIPVSSQLLVFSKTSAQFRWITPKTPRAIYFNDDTYVGWVPNAPLIEISTVGGSGVGEFYTLEQRSVPRPEIVRDNGACLQCHESHRTLRVPGHLTRSVFPGPDGLPHFRHGTINVDYRTPLTDRWGGWFVSGSPRTVHRGNAIGSDGAYGEFASGRLSRDHREYFDPRQYLTPYSDVVAHLVLAHQTRVHNSIARAGSEARRALAYREEMVRLFGEPSEELLASVERRIRAPAEELARDLLLAGEAVLTQPVRGDSGFAHDFQARGVRDAEGRSLRDLDLESRLFRFPCSYLIGSEAFGRLPDPVRTQADSMFDAV
ncbi:MAG: hypothetical protein OXN89_03995 [Bryobacterales bacterium]|nr:hypothetical protein [Bryobacterales bacterium]